MKEQFADVKVWDKVWSINYGWGKVSEISSDAFCVRFKNAVIWHTINGRRDSLHDHSNDHSQTLFWDEIKITPPPKPKREVTHTVERWVNIHAGDMPNKAYSSEEVATEAAEMSGKLNDRIACVKLTGTYTTME